MNDYNNGKIWGWNGGDCPVHPQSKVAYWLRNDSQRDAFGEAGHLNWRHALRDWDVIAFRVVEPYVELKTIWVNEYPDGRLKTYNSEIGARDEARNNIVQLPRHCIAVEYREVKK